MEEGRKESRRKETFDDLNDGKDHDHDGDDRRQTNGREKTNERVKMQSYEEALVAFRWKIEYCNKSWNRRKSSS